MEYNPKLWKKPDAITYGRAESSFLREEIQNGINDFYFSVIKITNKKFFYKIIILLLV